MHVGKNALLCLFALTLPGFAGVTVSSPGSGSVTSPVHFVAKATSACSKGVAATGIYTAPYALAFLNNGPNLDTNLTMSPGVYNVAVQQWDNCGGSTKTMVPLTVTANTNAKTFANLQNSKGWTGYALLPPAFGICTSCTSAG